MLPLFIVLLTATTLVQAQTATPQSTPTATPAPTEPPAIPVIQPTPVPSPPLSGDLWQQVGQVWAQNREAILLALIMALVTGVLVGVFFQRIAGQVADWLGRLFHYLFDNFASAPLIRLRYEKEYRDTLAAAVQELQGGSLVDRPIRLDQMYVPSLLTEETQVEVRGDLVDRYRSKDEMRRQQQTRAVSAWDAVRRFHRFVVLGGPGAGKTTYLYHLAFMCAQRRRPEVQDHLPIFIRFRELVRDLAQVTRLEDVFPKVLAEMNFPHAERFLERQLAQGRCLILLDGLDEVPAEDDHQRLIELVQEFANRQVREPKEGQSHNILVVSSRKYSYEHGQQLRGFAKTEVMEFDTPAIERFIYNWFGGEGELTKELLAGLKGNPRFLELARNPLLLLLIAYHYERERNLPRLRAELYQHCIRTRITQWNTIRGTHRGRFGENIKWRLLRELALYIFQEEKEGLLRRELLLEWLGAFAQNLRLPEDTLPETLLDEVARTSGLIQEWAIDRYGFSHQTLQEYFAAEAVDRQSDEQAAALLAEYLENPAWQEVILLYCGLADNTGPLLGRLMGQARQRRETGLWQLAGRCLAEGAQGIPEVRRQEVVDKLVGLLREAEGPLAADENEMVIANLKEFASDLLLPQVKALLAGSGSQTLLLAERLLPDTASPELRQLLSQQLSSLASAENAAERQAAIAAMGRLGSDDAGTIATLLRGLQEADPAARAEAALACGRLGRADEAVVVALRQTCSTDPADAPRRAALEALLALRQEALVDMVFIPAGEFLMGSGDEDKAAENDEKPRHRLYLPAYFMDRSPVTNGQFARFMEAGGYANPDYWSEAIEAGRWREGKFVDHQLHGGQSREQPALWEDKKWNSDEQPVVGVSWYEALAYARWAGKRLPNEAEWEKAASWEQGGRSAEGQGSGGAEGKQRRYPWGNSWQPGRANTKEARLERTTPVGQFSPEGDSPYGLVDMAGNVWEWCSTRWGNENRKEYGYPYNPDDGREALDGGDGVGRVLRGGSWANDQKLARCAARFRRDPGHWSDNWGFRCCCATSSLAPGSEF